MLSGVLPGIFPAALNHLLAGEDWARARLQPFAGQTVRLEAPPLARALNRHAEVDREIPSALNAAVAEVLAYVYQLAGWRTAGGRYPLPPRDIAVPPEFVPAEVGLG